MNSQTYDLIADIHGHHDKLVNLLAHLGYTPRRAFRGWTHGEGRKVIFLGDYIDRGPKVREVLHEVRGMVEAGDALALMGNHEFYAILNEAAAATLPADWRMTWDQFADREAEWGEWISWMKGLPLSLDLGGLRAVHACWDEGAIADLGGVGILPPETLKACFTRGTRERRAVDRLLCGPVLPVPDDALVLNPKGMPLTSVRVRWWDLPTEPYLIGDLALPESLAGRGMVEPCHLSEIPNYPPEASPVFFGHYWLPPESRRRPLAPNLACLDYSAAKGEAPLVSYRWDGESVLDAEKFTTH